MKKFLSCFLVILCSSILSFDFMMIDCVYAADTTGAESMVTIFCNIIGVITGTVGKAIAILILVSLAIGLFVGKVTWGLAIAVMVGMGLLFGAKDVIDTITDGLGTSDKICTNNNNPNPPDPPKT